MSTDDALVNRPNLRELASKLRSELVALHHRSQTSHLGSGLSVLDILVVLYFRVLRLDGPDSPGNDHLILSKGHAAPALYLVLAERGFIPRAEIEAYGTDGSVLAEHPVRSVHRHIEASTGSLGHGLSMGVGMAFALKNSGSNARVYVILSDGECQEGSVWEAAALASRLELGNLRAIIDWNGLQGYDRTDEIQPLQAVEGRFKASGWDVNSIDGHDMIELERALSAEPLRPSRPTLVLAMTVKGKGIPQIEGQLEWHYRSPSAEQKRDFIAAIMGVNSDVNSLSGGRSK